MEISKEAKKRILKLADLMERLPPEARNHFDMSAWCAHEGAGDHEHLKRGDTVARKHVLSCGTTACAAGWAATMPYFKKIGLSLIWDGYDATLHYKGVRDNMFDGLMQAFDITYDKAASLFGSTRSEATPKQWARHARGLVREWTASP